MPDEAVPWMIGGGVRHSVEVARLLSYVAFGGNEGIVGAKDLEVRPLSTPGGGVRIAKGAAAIKNRGVGFDYDSYAARWPSEDSVAIGATGSGSKRSDMVIARIENPFQAGEPWAQPSSADLAAGTAIFRRIAVISNVPEGAKTLAEAGQSGYSAIPLARIDLPASTSTVLATHIVDLRRLVVAQRADAFNVFAPTGTQVLTSTTNTNWPTGANFTVDVPDWCTHVQMRAILGGIAFGSAGQTQNAVGSLRLSLGSASGEGTQYNVSATGVDRTTLLAGAAMLSVPSGLRGTTQVVKIEGKKDSGSTSLTSDASSTISVEVRFVQRPEKN